MTYLLDTSVVTRLRSEFVRRAVDELAEQHVLARTTMTDLEVGFSARNDPEWDRLLGALSAFHEVEIDHRCFVRALQVQRMLAERGLRGRKVPDLLIAAAGEISSFVVLHHDHDFDHIASVTGQPVAWVVPPGTVD